MSIRFVPFVCAVVVLSACADSPTAPSAVSSPTAIGQATGGRFTPFSEAGREPLSVPNDSPSGPAIITRVGADSSGYKVDWTIQFPNNTSKARIVAYLQHADGRVTKEYDEDIVTDGVSPIRGVWDYTFTEAGRYYTMVKVLKSGAATVDRPWSEAVWFTVGQPAAAGEPCPYVGEEFSPLRCVGWQG